MEGSSLRGFLQDRVTVFPVMASTCGAPSGGCFLPAVFRGAGQPRPAWRAVVARHAQLDVLEVIEGRNARFNCKVSGTPPPTVTWSHFDQPLADNEDVRIVQEGGRHSLIIFHVTNEDEGFYTVTARNGQGEVENSAELYVQEPRPAISSQMSQRCPENEVERFTNARTSSSRWYDLDVVEGKESVLKCKVAGLPYPTIAWFHNGKRIDSTEDRKMTQFRDIHSLVIRSVCHAHGGVYKSVISNKIGKATCYSHLYVTDMLPDPPEGGGRGVEDGGVAEGSMDECTALILVPYSLMILHVYVPVSDRAADLRVISQVPSSASRTTCRGPLFTVTLSLSLPAPGYMGLRYSSSDVMGLLTFMGTPRFPRCS
ncbi:hypothetical protein CRUP_000359 [Coryphaenoides rupestris]|nr:hypothetical protein CRUP_000359 [Coryphaenoides rupestris]